MRRGLALVWLAIVGAWGADSPTPGACIVQGQVVNAVTAEPLKKAQVTLRNASTNSSLSATSDQAGSYSLAGAEPGTYDLLVQRRGFVSSGTSVSLQGTGVGWACPAPPPGQAVVDAVIRLAPQAVMAGRVVDRDGEPIPGASVQAIQSHGSGSAQRYSVAATATTNDLGEYRIFGLASGRYYLGAAYRSEAGFGAVYYPGTEEAGRALPVDIRAGFEANGLNLTISEIRSVMIRGVVRGPAGPAAEGLMIVAAPCDAGPLNRATTTVKGRDGAFTLRDLTPGCYVLAADLYAGGKRFSARLATSIGEANLDDVHLTLLPPVQLAGRIGKEDANELQLQRVVVNIQSRASKVTASGAASDDGHFLMNNIVPEIYDVSVVVPDGYYLKSARVGDADVMQAGLDMSHGGNGQLDLEISGAGGAVEGSVVDPHDHPIAGARVVLIPEGTPRGPAQPRSTVTDKMGRFQVRGMAPGDYKVYGSPELDAMALEDLVFARQLDGQEKRVSIREHGLEVVVVKAADVMKR
jgi:hypothetical protein